MMSAQLQICLPNPKNALAILFVNIHKNDFVFSLFILSAGFDCINESAM